VTFEEKKAYLKVLREVNVASAEADWVCEELEKAWAALEFYANDRRFYRSGELDEFGKPGLLNSEIFEDSGKRARKALGDE
jgi:hypothetical protein